MTWLILCIVCVVLAALSLTLPLMKRLGILRFGAAGFFSVLALVGLISTSMVSVPSDKVGVVRKLYGTSNLPPGHLIATEGQNGTQADIIPPGAFRFSPFYNVFNDVRMMPIVTIPQGFYGRIITRDGTAQAEGQIMADAWPETDFSLFLDPVYFLSHGGKKGLQASVLRPGTYLLNLELYNIRIGYEKNGKDTVSSRDDVYDQNGIHQEETPFTTSLTRVPAGFVGVVRSTINEQGAQCHETTATTEGDGLVAKLVTRGCRGIWSESLSPGDYYLNRDAYEVTLVDTRVQALEFKGGYTRRYIDLKVDQKGDFTQTERPEIKEFDPKVSVDPAVNTKVEGWEVPQELRVIIQVQPQHAPLVVAAVGGLQDIERRIMVPAIRSVVRNVFGGGISEGKNIRPTRILDLIENRPALEVAIQSLVTEDARRAGVDVKEIRLGESVIPPELLLARQREQLAQQLKRAYEQEQQAQIQRQSSEQARATADQQGTLVLAQIAVQTAELQEKKRAAEGRAERAFLEQQAAGQTAQAEVLGRDSVLRLQQTKMLMELLSIHPEIIGNLRLPSTLVLGGGLLDSAVAVLGGSLGGGNNNITPDRSRLPAPGVPLLSAPAR